MNRWTNPSDVPSTRGIRLRPAGGRTIVLCACSVLVLSGPGDLHSRAPGRDAGEITDLFGSELKLPPPRIAANSVELCLTVPSHDPE